MKIALCLEGLSGGSNDTGDPVGYKMGYEGFQSHILDGNDVDVFLHSWNTNNVQIEEIKTLYKPKLYSFEEQKHFSDHTKTHSIKSRWYSHMQSVSLKREYELLHNFRYDFVITSRFDVCLFSDFNFEEYNPSYFYSPDFNQTATLFNDVFFFSNSSSMDSFSSLYNHLDTYLQGGVELSTHALSRHHAQILGFSDKLKFIKHPRVDYQLCRRIAPNI